MTLSPRNKPRCWAIVPAAGVGSRFGGAFPKQYFSLCGKTVLEHSVERILSLPFIETVHVPVSSSDNYWPQTELSKRTDIVLIGGGKERADSVLNALNAIAAVAGDSDWVLVHDAARPCVKVEDINRLYAEVCKLGVGGILASPVADTVKQLNEGCIEKTIDRSSLWLAQTPQIFPVGILRECLSLALEKGLAVTDEASAVELFGHKPIVVQGSSVNLKITRPGDLPIAEAILSMQSNCT